MGDSRAGSTFGAIAMIATMPITATGRPTAPISKKPIGSSPASSICPATTRLVDVPISVVMPPSSAANDNGISSLLTETCRRAAHDEICGISIATIGVLFKKADETAVGGSTRSRGRRYQPLSPRVRCMIGVSAPVFWTAAATTYRAATVNGAGLLNPLSACSVSMTPKTSSVTVAPKITSAGDMPVRTSRSRTPAMTARVSQASSVTSRTLGDQRRAACAAMPIEGAQPKGAVARSVHEFGAGGHGSALARASRDSSRHCVQPGPGSPILHGSRAVGDARPDADYDVAAWWDENPPQAFDVLVPPVSTFSCSTLHPSRWRVASPCTGLSSTRTTPLSGCAGRPRRARSTPTSCRGSVDPTRSSQGVSAVVDEVRVLRLLRSASDDLAVLEREVDANEARRGDPLWRRGVEYRIVTAIEACVDVAQHVCSSEGWGPPSDNGHAIVLLGSHGVIDQAVGLHAAGGRLSQRARPRIRPRRHSGRCAAGRP